MESSCTEMPYWKGRKGWGKSPLLAAISCAELLAPTNFAGWDSEGKPVGKPTASPLVQIAALSESQADNTMSLVIQMLSNGQAVYYYPYLDINLSKITYPGGKKLEKVTASPRGREGNRATFVVMDETHLWVPAEKGPELYQALSRNLAKMNRRWVATTNAHAPGENSVAETLYNQHVVAINGTGFDTKMLFDTREVFVDDLSDKEEVLPALKYVYGDAWWIDVENFFIEIQGTPEHIARRFFFNQHVEGSSTWIKPKVWEGCREKDLLARRRLRTNDVIALGFKGNTIRGAAVVGCRLEDGALFDLGWWENPNLDSTARWEVPFKDVDTRLRNLMMKYRVAKVVADANQYQDIIGRWAADYEDEVEEFWVQNKTKMAKAVEQFESAVETKRLLWVSADISRHVQSCHLEEVPQGYILRQETQSSKRYIFGAQAAVLAFEAATLAIEEGALRPMADNTLYTF
jgi:hypothetical protein